MNNDALLVGVSNLFPNQNASTAPTSWAMDIPLAVLQALPNTPGTMLSLAKRSSLLPVFPNSAQELNPICVDIKNIRVEATGDQVLSSAELGLRIIGGRFIAGTPSERGMGVYGEGGSHRAMYTVEAPDSWFEDIGRAQLREGMAQVEIDPDSRR
jgi:hypothetical protein